jgi:hypothetical protein
MRNLKFQKDDSVNFAKFVVSVVHLFSFDLTFSPENPTVFI